MRTIFILLCTLLLASEVKGQNQSGKVTTSGKITYEEKAKIEVKLEGDASQFADQIPNEQVSYKVLFFNPDFSLYQAIAKAKEEDNLDSHDGVMKIKMIAGGEGDKIFCDIKNRKKTEQKEFMTRIFLVDGDYTSQPWKLSGNFKTIMGYNCQEAVSQDTIRIVSAWFSTAIPVPTGPAGFGNLPGLILQIDINKGKRTITATSVDAAFSDQGIIKKPTDGKKVTSEEYKKIVDDKMKEMGVENGQGANQVIIRIKN